MSSAPTATLDTFERELRRAAKLLAEGRFEQAYTWAAEALALRPAHLLAQNLLGLILYQQRRFVPALAIFESLVRKNPDVISLRMNAGLAALNGGEVARAVEHLRRAVDLDAGHQRAFNALALAHLRRGERHLARAALLEASQDGLALRLDDTLHPELADELQTTLDDEVEALSPRLDFAPWEGFAEVSALLPLDGWRQADLATRAAPPPATSRPRSPITEELSIEDLAALSEPLPGPATPAKPPPLPAESPSIPPAATAPESPSIPAAATSPEPPPPPEAAPRRRLAERLAALALPEVRPGQEAMVRHGALILRLDRASRGALLRPDRLVLERGALRWQPAQRRRKGAEAGPFTVDGSALQVVSGAGLLVLRGPAALHLELLHLEEEALYLRESALLAAGAELHWENGRLPGARDGAPGLVHLHGAGFLALFSAGRPFSLDLLEEDQVRIKLPQLLGWSGTTVPRLLAEEGMVGFSGAGVLLLQLADPDGGGPVSCPT